MVSPFIEYSQLDSVTQILYAVCITVMAISIIYRVCERMAEAMQELDEEQERAKQKPKGKSQRPSEKD